MKYYTVKKIVRACLWILFFCVVLMAVRIFGFDGVQKKEARLEICDLLELSEDKTIEDAKWLYIRTDVRLTHEESGIDYNNVPTPNFAGLFNLYSLENADGTTVGLYFDNINRVAVRTPKYESVFSWDTSPPEEQKILFEKETLPGWILIKKETLSINLWPVAKEGMYEHCLEMKDGTVYRTQLNWTAPESVSSEILENDSNTNSIRVVFKDLDIGFFENLFYISPLKTIQKITPTGSNFIDIPTENGKLPKGEHVILLRKDAKSYVSVF